MMTDKAYEAYKQKCKAKRIKPSKREDLDRDMAVSQSEHEYEPIHIRKPRDFTGKAKTISEQLNALPDGRKYIITKEQLLEFQEMIRVDTCCE